MDMLPEFCQLTKMSKVLFQTLLKLALLGVTAAVDMTPILKLCPLNSAALTPADQNMPSLKIGHYHRQTDVLLPFLSPPDQGRYGYKEGGGGGGSGGCPHPPKKKKI